MERGKDLVSGFRIGIGACLNRCSYKGVILPDECFFTIILMTVKVNIKRTVEA